MILVFLNSIRPHFINTLNIFNSITLIRLVNALKLFSSFKIAILLKKPIHFGFPMALSIEPTTACNLRCPECPSGLKQFTRKTGNLTLELHQKIINESYKNLMYVNYYFQGEPYINPNLFAMISHSTSKNIFCSTSTNGHFLTDENCKQTIYSGLQSLIISIDGNSQESYVEYRKNGDLEKVKKGAKNLVNWKNKLKSKYPNIILQFLIVKTNEHLINEMKSFCDELGLNEFRIKTAQFYDFKNVNPLMPSNEQYSRYRKKKNGQYELKNKFKNQCW
ncbi:MAG: radical SAM protein, partial [Bacteroidota bacterium]|nr:radical SAM protein [Bacteroidota bacterium]